MRVALIHDWLVTFSGAERILEQLVRLYPESDIFSLVDFVPPGQRKFLGEKPIKTSFIQKLPFARRHFRWYFALFPLAIQSFDLSDYDLVISVSFSVAKGVMTDPDQLHICISCSPVRYAWDLQEQYLREHGFSRGLRSLLMRSVLLFTRVWDVASAPAVDEYVAISRFVARRIRKYYGRNSVVIYPPVATEEFALYPKKDDFYLAASRQVPYKRIDLIVEAFHSMPGRRLVVIGDGPEHQRIQMLAKGAPNIQILGHQPFSVLKDHMQRAKAFVFAAKEDFGIVVLEAQACGTPVIALGQGAVRETLQDGKTGLFFPDQTAEALKAAVERFEAMNFDPLVARANAASYSEAKFREAFSAFTAEAIARWRVYSGNGP
jgi:glycosyltransferase involved in cell wall biosynthesis